MGSLRRSTESRWKNSKAQSEQVFPEVHLFFAKIIVKKTIVITGSNES